MNALTDLLFPNRTLFLDYFEGVPDQGTEKCKHFLGCYRDLIKNREFPKNYVNGPTEQKSWIM